MLILNVPCLAVAGINTLQGQRQVADAQTGWPPKILLLHFARSQRPLHTFPPLINSWAATCHREKEGRRKTSQFSGAGQQLNYGLRLRVFFEAK